MTELVWSKGPLRTWYAARQTDRCSSPQDIVRLCSDIKRPGAVLWIRSGSETSVHDLNYLTGALQILPHPVILLTSDGDRGVPGSYPGSTVMKILSSPKIIAWYTQNYDGTMDHPKLKRYPIGFDFHTQGRLIRGTREATIQYMFEQRRLHTKKQPLIFCDAHLSYSHPERRDLHKLLLSKKDPHIVIQPTRVPFSEITKQYNRHEFGLSPRGNGLDCHRTWEMLVAGAIVITRTSSLDAMYIENQLPVVILNDWDELFDNLSAKLEMWRQQHSRHTQLDHLLPRLQFGHWIKE